MSGLNQRNNKIISPGLRLSMITLAVIGATMPCAAKPYFNPAFLTDDTDAVADLSRFESGNNQLPGVYRVDIYVNGEFVASHDLRFRAKGKQEASAGGASNQNATASMLSGSRAMPATSSAGDDTGLVACLTPGLLHRLNVNFSAVPGLEKYKDSQCVPVATLMPEMSSSFDFESQRFNVEIPQIFLESNVKGYIPPREWDEGINAGILNYAFNGSNGGGYKNYFLSLQSGLNVGPWRLRNNGAWTYSESSASKRNRWENISTYAERAIIPLKSELVVGDSNSDNALFDSYGFRGMRMYSVDNMYPDSQRGYAPTIRGVAGGRAKVTIRQNGYVIYQMFVSAGPFEIKDLNPTSTSGDLEVTIDENGGKSQKYTVPYSSVPLLQREGRVTYDVVMGKYRSGNVQQERPAVMQGTISGGLVHGVTLYGGAQIAERYQSVALGAGRNFGTWGALSADVTQARSKLADDSVHEGQSLRFLYAKSLSQLGTNFQLLGYRYSTRGFYTLSDAAYGSMEGYEYEYDENGEQHKIPILIDYHNLHQAKKGRLQVSISQHLKDYGSLYLSGNRQSYWNTDAMDAWYQFGYSASWYGISYNLSLSYNKNAGRNTPNRMASLTVSLPLGQWLAKGNSHRSDIENMFSTSSLSRASDGRMAVQSGVSGTMLENHNLSYGVFQGYSGNYGNTGNANVMLRGTYANGGLGYNYDRSGHQWNYQLSGGLVAHADGITLSQPLGDTNVLIKAPGAKGVSVENETGIKTDWRGYAVMPYATVYRRNRIALNTNTLDEHTDLDDNVSSVVPTEGALVRAEFKTHLGLRALVTLKLPTNIVPFGAVVTEKQTGITGIVGDGGQVYMSGLPVNGVLESKWGNGAQETCTASYHFSSQDLKQSVAQKIISCHS